MLKIVSQWGHACKKRNNNNKINRTCGHDQIKEGVGGAEVLKASIRVNVSWWIYAKTKKKGKKKKKLGSNPRNVTLLADLP